MKKIVLGLILMMVIVIPVKGEEYPPNTTFKLTYPDGSVYVTQDEEEMERLKEEWKKLVTKITDSNGEIKLVDWKEEGSIKIVEVLPPVGYEVENAETIVNLNEKEVTIINKKKSEKEDTTTPQEENEEEIQKPNEEEVKEEDCQIMDGGTSKIVKFNTMGGDSINNISICVTCAPETIILPTPKKDGYVFVGWYADSQLTKKVDGSTNDINNANWTKVNCYKYETIIYAKWQKEEVKETNKIDVPKTLDDVFTYVFMFGGSIIFIILIALGIKKTKKKDKE